MAEVIGDNTIPNGLSANVMRELLQSKNMLKNKGDMYIGTGIQENEVYKTGILSGPSQGGYVLAGTNTGNGVEIQYKSALDILNEDLTIGDFDGINIGKDAEASHVGSVAIGGSAKAYHVGAAAFGSAAQSSGENSVAVGTLAVALQSSSVAIGNGARTNQAIDPSQGESTGSIAIGKTAIANNVNSIALGVEAQATGNNTIAIGNGAQALTEGSCQIGCGTNTHGPSLQFRSRLIVNSDGHIHADTSDAVGGYKIRVVQSLPLAPAADTIYFVKP